jgi:hypothetical protein
MDQDLEQAVMQLHDIARLIETRVGQGLLSADVRDCADRLHQLNRPLKTREDTV